MLNGQKLQGVITSDEVQEILRIRGWERDFPLFTTINRVANKQLDPTWILRYEEGSIADVIPLLNSTDESSSAAAAAANGEKPKGPRLAPLLQISY